ncbi:bacteriocin-protection protein, YdeI/OmpD-associated family [Leptospira yanagawae serovar Saopaulo str. Sao Paulo = ATCC 700523]|uniref:Bacteriocin-protection protein, YdeI/OmpD-associated family n=2 Tax=Leptospira yanagawae TaxID=293069 RepID=A0ABY2M4G8_9LEPT|nr:YdeI/OmpD-associated family protein [Leptospira yanagawae]EOQ89663.1 bacteriocin-protection protein, YdeI/OmpD-associated family [Leptospira yanagawae serovar Saopaulo str. Sao Paulo = ATCC 700523]TGL23962.1 bacteriocin-protection protein, YdeI/OmpD-associated family [Leptospira yanagawae]
MTFKKDIVIKSFSSQKEWKDWLSVHFDSIDDGIWLRIFKKDSGIKTITYDEALEEALCFGWIDSQKKKYDETSWIQKFTPRRAKSIWSKRNREKVEKLIKEKRMQPSGLKEVEAAKKDGRWEKAYDSQSNMEMPKDFLVQLKKNKKAHEFFQSLNKSNHFAIAWRLQTAKKPETREKRMKQLLEMMENQQKLH